MIEAIIRNYLEEKLDVPVFMEKPETKPMSYVLVDLTGCTRNRKLFHSMIAIQSYADTMFEAAKLDEQVLEAMDGIITLDEITSIGLNSSYEFTDTSEKKYRYQAVYDITHYGR